jgi:hypothetical protein
MLEFVAIMLAVFAVAVVAILVNRNLIYLAAIAINTIILAVLDYSAAENRYLAILSLIMLLILAVRFYEHYRE